MKNSEKKLSFFIGTSMWGCGNSILYFVYGTIILYFLTDVFGINPVFVGTTVLTTCIGAFTMYVALSMGYT